MPKLESALGGPEMEEAAKTMLYKLRKDGKPLDELCYLRVGPEDFKSSVALVGFCELLHRGWMNKVDSNNGVFSPSRELVSKITSSVRV